jgi:hypothetical protein
VSENYHTQLLVYTDNASTSMLFLRAQCNLCGAAMKLNEYWRSSFCSGLACASDGSDIVGPEKGRLSEAGWSSCCGQLAGARPGDLLCGSRVIVSRRAFTDRSSCSKQPAIQFLTSVTYTIFAQERFICHMRDVCNEGIYSHCRDWLFWLLMLHRGSWPKVQLLWLRAFVAFLSPFM